jgi:8-oxo-dGTP pyrophosphatase MutT (NUDIX family)
MRRFLQLIGTLIFFGAWIAFWIYYRRGHGRTRVVVVHEGKVLVMKQWISGGKWHLPGGGLRKDEPMAEGAARELLEETSLQLDPRQLKPVGKARYTNFGLAYDYYVFATGVGSSAVRAQRIEISELAWLRPADLTPRNAQADTLRAVEMVRSEGRLLK